MTFLLITHGIFYLLFILPSYEWCPCVSVSVQNDNHLKGYFDADCQIAFSEVKDGNLVTNVNVIVAGTNILTISKAVVWDDNEDNFDPRSPTDYITYPLGLGGHNKWANWHIEVRSPDNNTLLRSTYLQGPGRSPNGQCEWVDQLDFEPQELNYSSYGIWDWDWEVNGIQYTRVLVYVWEGDEDFYNDPIGYFLIERSGTVGSTLHLSDNDYTPNPDGHDVDLDFTTLSYNLDRLEKAKRPRKEVFKRDVKKGKITEKW